MDVGVVVDNAPAARLVRRVLDDARIKVFDAQDRSGAIMGVGSLAEQGLAGVLLLDSDTLEDRALEELRLEIGHLVRIGNAARPRRLVLAIPQVEAILFTDLRGLEKALGKQLTAEQAMEARFRPKAVFYRLLGKPKDAEKCAITIINRLGDDSLRRMAEHPMMREIREYVEQVQPRARLRSISDPPGRWKRARRTKIRHAS